MRLARAKISALGRCLVLCGTLLLAACQSELYSNISESEANEMLAVLLQHGLAAKKAAAGDERFTITVNDDETLRALQVLREAGLPRTERSTMGQVFARSGIVSSPFEERIRFVYALGEEVSGTLEQIDGVLAARVHIVLPEEPELGQELRPSSAAVFLKQRSNTDLDYLIPQVRRLVSNAIEGVDYEQVSVTLVEARAMDIPAPAEVTALSEVLPGLEVHASSVGTLYLITGGLVSLLVLSIAGNAILAVRAVRKRGTPRKAAQ